MTNLVDRVDQRETIVETLDIFVGLNARLVEPFDLGRIKIALLCHFWFSKAGHLCTEHSACGTAVQRYYDGVVPTKLYPGRAERIDRLFDRVLRAEEARDHIRRLDYGRH